MPQSPSFHGIRPGCVSPTIPRFASPYAIGYRYRRLRWTARSWRPASFADRTILFSVVRRNLRRCLSNRVKFKLSLGLCFQKAGTTSWVRAQERSLLLCLWAQTGRLAGFWLYFSMLYEGRLKSTLKITLHSKNLEFIKHLTWSCLISVLFFKHG